MPRRATHISVAEPRLRRRQGNLHIGSRWQAHANTMEVYIRDAPAIQPSCQPFFLKMCASRFGKAKLTAKLTCYPFQQIWHDHYCARLGKTKAASQSAELQAQPAGFSTPPAIRIRLGLKNTPQSSGAWSEMRVDRWLSLQWWWSTASPLAECVMLKK